MGVKGVGKGRPLVNEDFSELEEGEDDAEDYEEEQAEEELYERSNFAATPTLRDRSQLKRPSYFEHSEDGQDSVDDEFHPPDKKAKHQSRVTRNSDSVDTIADSSSGQPEQMDAVKTERGPHSPFDVPVEGSPNEFSNSNSSSIQPIVNYFGIRGNTNDTVASFNSPFFSNGFGNYPPTAYQPFAQPMYTTTQALAQQQLTYPHTLGAAGLDATNNFMDSSSGADPYSSDPVTDDNDVPEGFCESEWYSNYLKQTPQQ